MEVEGKAMNNVRQLLEVKGRNVWFISSTSTVYEGLQLLAEKNIGAVPVVDEGKLVGIFSERDYARKVILKGISSINTSIGELMVREVVYVSPEDSIDQCMSLMSEKHIRHLPVLIDNELIGIISIGDVVKHIIKHQKFTIRELEKYITGGYRL